MAKKKRTWKRYLITDEERGHRKPLFSEEGAMKQYSLRLITPVYDWCKKMGHDYIRQLLTDAKESATKIK